MDQQQLLINENEARLFVVRCMTSPSVGCKRTHAEIMAEALISADRRKVFTHGIRLLERYVDDVVRGYVSNTAEPSIVRETPATALVDGNNAEGHVVGNFAMQLAIQKARNVGIGWVAARGSNHYGMAAFYSMQALRYGLIGISMTNASPMVAPTRAKEGVLGTNPISVAARAENEDSYVLDMATTTVPYNKVHMKHLRKEDIPRGWALDKHGRDTTDPAMMFDGGTLLPLGGSEDTGGYKGYGLSFLVDLFSGVLAGGAFGSGVRFWTHEQTAPANVAHTFACIDPAAFSAGFPSRLQELIDQCRNAEPVDALRPVLVPGDPERAAERSTQAIGGILYSRIIVEALDKLAMRLNVEPIARESA